MYEVRGVEGGRQVFKYASTVILREVALLEGRLTL